MGFLWEAPGEISSRSPVDFTGLRRCLRLVGRGFRHLLEGGKELYEAGVKAGEYALGADAFEEDVGHFWGLLETHPYMRAREGLAVCLWQMDQRQEAIEQYQEMLRLNPGDNQGIRFLLLPSLMEEGMEKETEQLLAAYEDDATATWCYTRALLLTRTRPTWVPYVA